ncbi:MAG: endonuclease/exonuclease/phosphatase family protein [Actinomycetota bacterium]|nr:endonuclease/exonuclease/phosphatase family protein [Actinomycetota bacterium]
MGEPLRLMTVNLLHGGADVGAFRQLLQRFDPEVVVTQELGFACAAVLREKFANHWLNPAHGFAGRGIATRLEASFGDIPMPFRYGTWARLVVDGREWSLAGVHLLNPIEFPWWRSVQGRSDQLEAIQSWIDEVTSGPLVVAGDLNASPRWPAYRQLAARLTDLPAAFASTQDSRPERTWGWRPGWPRMLRIDHVFGSSVDPVAVSVVPIEGSDHDAVVVDLVAR